MMAPLLIAALVLAGIGSIIMGFFTGGAVLISAAAICAILAEILGALLDAQIARAGD